MSSSEVVSAVLCYLFNDIERFEFVFDCDDGNIPDNVYEFVGAENVGFYRAEKLIYNLILERLGFNND